MALADNIMQQVTPVVILGTINNQGGVQAAGGVMPRQYSTVTNQIISTNGGGFSIPAGGKALVQSWDSEAVFVKLGPNVSVTDASFILKAGTGVDDGNGGSYMIDDYVGPVTVTAAGTVRCNVAIYS